MTNKLTADALAAVREVVAEELGKALGGESIAESLRQQLDELRKSERQPVRKTLDDLQQRADEIRKSDHKLSPAQAMARVIKANPELYALHRAETAERRGDPRRFD